MASGAQVDPTRHHRAAGGNPPERPGTRTYNVQSAGVVVFRVSKLGKDQLQKDPCEGNRLKGNSNLKRKQWNQSKRLSRDVGLRPTRAWNTTARTVERETSRRFGRWGICRKRSTSSSLFNQTGRTLLISLKLGLFCVGKRASCFASGGTGAGMPSSAEALQWHPQGGPVGDRLRDF